MAKKTKKSRKVKRTQVREITPQTVNMEEVSAVAPTATKTGTAPIGTTPVIKERTTLVPELKRLGVVLAVIAVIFIILILIF